MKKTGKVYKCIGVEEIVNELWAQFFRIGNTYEEANLDSHGFNVCEETDLLLFENKGYPLYVDKDQFVEVKEETT